MGMIGAFLGLKLTIFTIFAASIAGSLFGLSTMLMVWIKRTRRYRALNHGVAGQGLAIGAFALRFYQMPFGVFLANGYGGVVFGNRS